MRVCSCSQENRFACVQVCVYIACGGEKTSSVVFPQAGSSLFFKTGSLLGLELSKQARLGSPWDLLTSTS